VLHMPARLRRFVQPMVRASAVLEALRDLPVADVRTVLGEGPVLVLAPHPDDESLGCGGLMAEHHVRGHEVHVLVLTDGAGSHPGSREYPAARLTSVRMAEARAAIAALGLPADRIDFLGLPDGRAPLSGKRLKDAASRVAAHARARGVRTICTTCPHDPHHDHRAAYRLGQLVAREVGARLLLYPVWTWTLPPTAWVPDIPLRGARLDIARHLATKRRAIACHRSQITDLIRDDPSGFRMSPEFLAIFDWPFEVFVDA
jgi:LmbE family N-acetylglucosaminyl deacetylase